MRPDEMITMLASIKASVDEFQATMAAEAAERRRLTEELEQEQGRANRLCSEVHDLRSVSKNDRRRFRDFRRKVIEVLRIHAERIVELEAELGVRATGGGVAILDLGDE